MSIVRFSNPTYVTVKLFRPWGTDIEKLPSALVWVATFVPVTVTVAPDAGWLFAAVTIPVIIRWAKEEREKSVNKNAKPHLGEIHLASMGVKIRVNGPQAKKKNLYNNSLRAFNFFLTKPSLSIDRIIEPGAACRKKVISHFSR